MGEPFSAAEAQKICLSFIQNKYWRGKAAIGETELVAGGAFPVYHIKGTIRMKSRGVMGRFIFTEAPYTFDVKVHALEGSIISYELS
ncbi:MAG: hypothetical protein KKF26_01165 [Chloroflexi bacterium]|nr:hypothetical protein [Chloroflexota bacterium]